MTARIIDVSVPISESMPIYPGDPGVEVVPDLRIARGNECNVSQLCLGTHTGTHLDPPYHFIESGLTIDQIPLARFVGPAVVALAQDVDQITATTLAGLHLPKGVERLLLKTKNSRFWSDPHFHEDFTALSGDAATWLVNERIKLVGIDYLSIEPFGAKDPVVHRTLLGAGVIILEGLDLREVEPGDYHLTCVPLRLKKGDGSPVRAYLMEG